MNIGLDMMGGDYAPAAAVQGVAAFLRETSFLPRLFLFGDQNILAPLLQQAAVDPATYVIVHAPEVIGMHEHPTKAFREKQQSSIALGYTYLRDGGIDAFISAGNTGAMMVGALTHLQVIDQVHRPAISSIIPKENGRTGLLLDVGLNADCKPENLNQFAVMGSLYAQHILGIDDPGVALINIGEEESKGNLLVQAAYPLLKANPRIRFTGNVEGRDILRDKADVMVCEGFTGNVILKFAESLFELNHRKNINHPFFDTFNFELYGGTPILGITKPVIIGHGVSQAMAFGRMIPLAVKMVEKDFISRIVDFRV